MSVGRKVLGAGLAAGVGIGAVGYYASEMEVPPAFALRPLTELPDEVPAGARQEALICAADTPTPCSAENALGVLVNSTQVEVPFDEMPEHTRQAVIDAEDRKFYEHSGIDMRRSVAAALEDLASGRADEGASTIDRQVAGLGIYGELTPAQKRECGIAVAGTELLSRSVGEQVSEGCLALTMNEEMSKDEILSVYLNNVYFGRGATGIEAAAQAYFGVSARDLSQQRSMVLAGVLPRPSSMDVNVTNPNDPAQAEQFQTEATRLKANYERVIDSMQNAGHLTEEQAEEYRNQQIRLVPYQPRVLNNFDRANQIGARHYMDMVLDEAAELLGTDRGALHGYTIHTTLNTAHQSAMNEVIASEPIVQQPGMNAAGVSLNRDGGVAAMVGGRNYDELQINLATGAAGGGSGRDSGSSNKGFALAYALEHGWSLDQVMNVEGSLTIPDANNGEDWVIDSGNGCDRLDRSTPCQMTVEEGIAVSSNNVAGQLVQEFGIEPIAQEMQALGVDISEPFYPSLVLGSGEASPLGEATGYNNLLLRHGNAVDTHIITRITDGLGNVVYEYEPESGTQVVQVQTAQGVIQALNGVIRYGTAEGAVAEPSGPMSAAGKTGTANNLTDTWFTGSVCDNENGGQTASFWIGNPAGKIPLQGVSSFDNAEMWNAYVQRVVPPDDTCNL